MARGSAAASSSNWRSARGSEWGADHDDEDHDDENRGEEPPPAADHEATPSDPRGGHVAPADSSASPPGFDGDAERGGAASGTGAHALDAEGAVFPPLDFRRYRSPRGPGRLRCLDRLDFGQVDGAFGSQSRHGSPGPVVPSHCEGDTTAIGGARPDGSLGGASDSSATPPGFDGDAERGGAASGTGAHALDAEGAVLPPLDFRRCRSPRGPGRVRCLDRGDFGQVDGAFGSQSRHGSPGPVVPSHCEGDTTAIGGARPDGSLGGASGGGPGLGHGSVPGAHSDVEAHGDRVLLLPLGAVCVGGGALAVAQQDPGSEQCGADDGRPGGASVAHREGAVQF